MTCERTKKNKREWLYNKDICLFRRKLVFKMENWLDDTIIMRYKIPILTGRFHTVGLSHKFIFYFLF